jgi:Flp pilus assembly protein TadG
MKEIVMRSPLKNLLSKSKQRGAVVIIFGLALTSVFGFMGLSLDLAQTYDRKTELQNAADAAALAGARRLVGTTAGIDAAVLDAQNIAALHKFKFQTAVGLNAATIKFSTSPDTAEGSWLDATAAKLVASTIFFIKIDTRGFDANYGKVNTNFMQAVSSTSSTNTFGRAVAGRFILGVAPIAVCALETAKYSELLHTGLASELKEYGYRRGISYNIMDINPLGSAALKFLLNPIDVPPAANDNSACTTSNAGASSLTPYMCGGTTSIISSLPGYVYVNTGTSASADKELNSRFNEYGNGAGSCQVASAPPDSNVQEYKVNIGGSIKLDSPSVNTKIPKIWMTNEPIQQSIELDPALHKPIVPQPSDIKYGTLWAYNHAVQYSASPPAGGYVPYSTADWPKLYPTGATGTGPTPIALAAYPAGASATPYNAAAFSTPPASNGPGVADRRVLNLALVNCSTLSGTVKSSGGNSCQTIQVLGVGRFFMTIKSNLPNNLHMEFAGLISDSTLTKDIKLYH